MPYKERSRQNQYHRERARRIRAEFMKGKVCAKCGSMEDLELDHVDPSTKDPALKGQTRGGTRGCAVWSWSPERRARELAKCQVLCSNCHLEKTRDERRAQRRPLKHGTVHGYKVHSCRCDKCRAGNAAYNMALKNRSPSPVV